jgi:hypothetical protein
MIHSCGWQPESMVRAYSLLQPAFQHFCFVDFEIHRSYIQNYFPLY